jgi:hypothetical protein
MTGMALWRAIVDYPPIAESPTAEFYINTSILKDSLDGV